MGAYFDSVSGTLKSSIAKAGILDAISHYANEDFYQKRSEIGQAI